MFPFLIQASVHFPSFSSTLNGFFFLDFCLCERGLERLVSIDIPMRTALTATETAKRRVRSCRSGRMEAGFLQVSFHLF